MKKNKYYVVWKGFNTGVFSSWSACREVIQGYSGAVYKSFPSLSEAQKAFNDKSYMFKQKQKPQLHSSIVENSLSVDAACSGNPGVMEYRGVYVKTGEEVFKKGPYAYGTNNVGEFLALVHGLALLKKMNSSIPIYSDSTIAMGWVAQKKCKTKLENIPENQELFSLISRAESWLRQNTYVTKILKWDTKSWGEIPADFGRK